MEKVSIKLFILFLFFYISFYIYPVDWKKTISKYGSSICLIEVIDNIGSKVSGSGFVFSKEGFILTNAHVVKMAYFSKDYRIETKFLNSSFSDKIYTGNVIAIDIEKDLAIIKIDRNFDNYCILGDSSKVENMDEILVIGYPLGMGFKSTPGYVQSFQDIKEYGKMLDLSAIVDPGNSGGPVFNKDSEVIGIVTAKFLGYNFNLAIPINHTKDFINASLKSRKIKITSEPSGANVYLGSTSAGKTPLNIEIFGVKNHIKISLDGYLDIEKEIDSSVKNGETINFILEKRSTKIINITSLPSKSNVYIDDKFYGATPIQVKIDGQKSVKLVVKSNWYSDYQEEILFDSREQYNIFVKMKPDLYSEVSQEHGNTGFTFYMPTSFIETLNFFKLFKVGTGFNYMVNYPTNGIVRFYFSTDFIFAGSQKDINPEMPQGMANAFFYLNDYSFGISFRAPLWRFPIIGGVAGKFAYYVVSYNIYNFIIGGFGLGLGAELHLGFQLYVNEYVGFYFYYKIGLVPDLFYALINHLFSNIDGHYISFGIRF